MHTHSLYTLLVHYSVFGVGVPGHRWGVRSQEDHMGNNCLPPLTCGNRPIIWSSYRHTFAWNRGYPSMTGSSSPRQKSSSGPRRAACLVCPICGRIRPRYRQAFPGGTPRERAPTVRLICPICAGTDSRPAGITERFGDTRGISSTTGRRIQANRTNAPRVSCGIDSELPAGRRQSSRGPAPVLVDTGHCLDAGATLGAHDRSSPLATAEAARARGEDRPVAALGMGRRAARGPDLSGPHPRRGGPACRARGAAHDR